MSTALGVAPDSSGQGCDALTHRLAIAGQWASTGVISGLVVSGRQDLRYAVSPGLAVCSMGETDGMSIAWWDGGGSPYTENVVDAGDATYPRIDAIYIISYTGQPDNKVHIKVQQGTPSASPVRPQVEAGGQVIGWRRIPAGATSTAAAMDDGDIDYAISYQSSMGLLAEYVDRRTEVWGYGTPRDWVTEYPITFHLPSDRQVELTYDADVAYVIHGPNGGMLPVGDNDWASWAVTFRLDGDDVPCSTRETLLKHSVWTHAHNSVILNLKRGDHTVMVKQGLASKQGTGEAYMHYGDNDGLSYPGRTVRAWDRGPSR